MATLSFSLAPSALVRLHDALTCLAKFSETVSIEAEYDLLRLSALNLSKTAYASFVLDADKFFEKFSFSIRTNHPAARKTRSGRFSCQIYLKALLSVFKGRTNDVRGKDTAIERCDVELQDNEDEAECRLVIKMICGHGVVKSYKLTYESAAVQHAVFDRSKTRNRWAIESRFLREIIDHFSPSAEQLDIYSENGKAIFTSFTTKITDGKEILKQPVHTSVAIDTKDFEEFMVEENLHVAIIVKDFKAVVTHADTAKATITARYIRPCRPLHLAYEFEGIACEFTLMTRGEVDDEEPDSSRPPASALSARNTPRPVQANTSRSVPARESMPPPASRPTQRPTQASTPASRSISIPRHAPLIDHDSLFVPMDDDKQWDEPNYDDDTEDRLGWDATADQETFNSTFDQRIQETLPGQRPDENQQIAAADEMGIPPTQRISQIRGLFD
ncbi:hypothetical protein DTO027B5_6756 [Paecilomyces variotii]|nr:hypothetical protein DTO032I3_8975 [Paecilomyces variotii]KAJ9279412.1 hypothetical protein DTO021D3_3868 [Paecilomyces variotii]KAJ9321834.1 hypothetical protein DTO027B3_7094 [Paecilomyces variotii]KAJ9331536.1 hypothetical protein DTO027B5_6756 [Paecilomyces variotii]KAJ9341257.1 hypothetical protein DTO027B6_6238 [Paecilomyces variotii]